MHLWLVDIGSVLVPCKTTPHTTNTTQPNEWDSNLSLGSKTHTLAIAPSSHSRDSSKAPRGKRIVHIGKMKRKTTSSSSLYEIIPPQRSATHPRYNESLTLSSA